MNLLTWHGTILSFAPSGTIVQTSLLAALGSNSAVSLDLLDPTLAGPTESPNLPDTEVLPGPKPHTIQCRKDGLFLSMPPDQATPEFIREKPQDWETFLVLPVLQTASLGWLLSHGWHHKAQAIARISIQLMPAFQLQVGPHAVPLAACVFTLADHGRRLHIRSGQVDLHLTQDPDGQPIQVVGLAARDDQHQFADVQARPAFQSGANCRWRLPQESDIVSLPLFVSDADRDWSFDKFWQDSDPVLGRLHGSCRIGRASQVWVVLARFAEGTLFDLNGAFPETGYLGNIHHPLPNGMYRSEDLVSVDRAVLDSAPMLPGSHIVFVNGNLQNYYHWLVDSLMALDVMNPIAPPAARLLLPGTIAGFRDRPINRFDHLAVLRATGLAERAVTEVPQGVHFARLEEAIWLEDYYIEKIPGVYLRAFRDRVLQQRDAARPRRRICIRRHGLRTVVNAQQVETFLAKHDFTFHSLEDMPPAEQIALFQDAEYIVAPHGAGLANLMFCQAGTKVLEMSPDAEFRPFFWLLSNKLGLSHGVLPSATHDGTFNGKMRVEPERFRKLYWMLHARI